VFNADDKLVVISIIIIITIIIIIIILLAVTQAVRVELRANARSPKLVLQAASSEHDRKASMLRHVSRLLDRDLLSRA
jgi:type II secretory pathway pseudopilin PulG